MHLKYSVIKPILKKLTNNIANYRHISLLTSSSKISEKAIYERLLEHYY